MASVRDSICAFGWKAQDFALRGVDGKTYALADVRGAKGTLVVFICNHCPYVKASIDRIVREAEALREIGIGTIAIMPNDTATYRDNSFDNMKTFAAAHGFTFPYVIDETQEVARAYDAQCTPDFFGFNAKDELQYRGRLDAARTTPIRRCAARLVRGDERDRRNGSRPCGAAALDGLLDQVEALTAGVAAAVFLLVRLSFPLRLRYSHICSDARSSGPAPSPRVRGEGRGEGAVSRV